MSAAQFAGRSLPGFDTIAVQVLKFLVGRTDADEPTIAEVLGLTTLELRAAIAALERDQLVVRTAEAGVDPARWAALPPRSGLSTLLARRRTELAGWERYVDELEDEYWSATDRHVATGMLEVVTGAEQVTAVYAQLLASATHEVLHLAKPPYVGTAERPGGSGADADLAPGLRMRSVYDTSGFTDPVSLHTAIKGTVNGGVLRLLDDVPTKLAIFDRRAALLPLHPDDPAAGSIVVHATGLVEALVALFENLFDRAVPMALWGQVSGSAGSTSDGDDLLGGRIRDILRLMAAGLTDDAIARALGVSRRTVQKNISELADALGARTRFQIALLAAERGLVTRTAAAAQG